MQRMSTRWEPNRYCKRSPVLGLLANPQEPSILSPKGTEGSGLEGSDVTEMALLRVSRMARKLSSACSTCLLLGPLRLFWKVPRLPHTAHTTGEKHLFCAELAPDVLAPFAWLHFKSSVKDVHRKAAHLAQGSDEGQRQWENL